MKSNIRNFSIIAHIDHGKSTLADRFLELTNTFDNRSNVSQVLDNMELEKERGITIKLNAVSLDYKGYTLNLIDTPGHVDFSYEVSRSLAACEGAILVVDASQGIEAQTLANLYLALENDLTIIPVINKIDLPNANVPKVKEELVKTLGFKEEEILLCSAKTGIGVIERINPPVIKENAPLKALIFDSHFDSYKGVVLLVKVTEGSIKVKDKIYMMQKGSSFEVTEVGVNKITNKPLEKLSSGMVGYVAAAIKDITKVAVGDTITLEDNPALKPLHGYKPMKPMVFSGIFPIEASKYDDLKEDLEKLKLNDASLEFTPENSVALGFGFRTGFLGLLHMDIILERLEREFNLETIATTPSVVYKVGLTSGEEIEVSSPNEMPEKVKISYIKEPYIYTNIISPTEFIGPIMTLCQNKRGIYDTTEYINETRVNIHYYIPLGEIIYDFYDKLKSYTKGYASFDYEVSDYRVSKLVKMDILLNGDIVDALSVIVHEDFAYNKGREIVTKLRKTIPRQMFEVPIQASIGSKVIARENVSAMKKNVLAKCYGGDVSRKRKLLEKQKEGKKKMKMIGSVEVPKEAFLKLLSDEE